MLAAAGIVAKRLSRVAASLADDSHGFFTSLARMRSEMACALTLMSTVVKQAVAALAADCRIQRNTGSERAVGIGVVGAAETEFV